MHDAIAALDSSNGKQDCCHGLLSGSGNMLTEVLPVTKKSLQEEFRAVDLSAASLFGFYIATTSRSAVDLLQVRALAEVVERITGRTPACYMLLELGHKGRVDVTLYADARCSMPIPLQLHEDGGDETATLYPVAASR